MEDRLPHSRHCKLILDSVSDVIYVVDKNKQIISFNRAAEKISGVPAAKALKSKCYEVFQSNICQNECGMEKALELGTETRDLRAHILNSSGATIPVDVHTAILHNEKGEVEGALEIIRDQSAIEHLRKELKQNYSFSDIISKSRVLNKIFTILPDVAESESAVLIQGAFGTGRELLARVIHNLSPRKVQPWIQVNCGSLPPHLFEAEIFGYIKDAFPEAKEVKPGALALAEKGTIYFNEIGETNLATQQKLLRLIKDNEFQALGSNRVQKADVRILASTNRDLRESVSQGRFRDDLFFRLAVVKLELPALKDRCEDIPYLIDHFIQLFNARKDKDIMGVSPQALELLMSYDYPYNIRELERVLEYGFVVCRGPIIEVQHLPVEIQNFRKTKLAVTTLHHGDFPDEPTRIREALRRHHGNLCSACGDLGFHRTTLWRKMKQYGIQRSEFREAW
jgi:PAS domain S-box-containing protein